jgi:Tfp pilus assembly protein FimV
MTHRCFEIAAHNGLSAKRLSFGLFAALMTAGMLHAAEPAAMQASAQTLAMRSYSVQRGDTLDRVIQRTMANSPLKIELLRKAFVEGNPHAFVSGNVSRLRAGAVLQVPDHTRLLRSTLLPLLDAADADALTATGAARSFSASDRRSWVRFP